MIVLCRYAAVTSCVAALLGLGSTARAQATLDVLHTFPAAVPSQPKIIVQAGDGTVYGVTGGGSGNIQSVFRMTPDGTVTTLHAFKLGEVIDTLILGTDGQLYGSTQSLWDSHYGHPLTDGIVFHVSPDGQQFDALAGLNAATFTTQITQGPDGYLYAEMDPISFYSQIYRIAPSGGGRLFHTFDSNEWGYSQAFGSDGAMYTVSTVGYLSSTTRVLRIGVDGTSSVLGTVSGNPPVTYGPTEGLVAGLDGNLYGVTTTSMFRVTPGSNGTVSVIHTFNSSAGDPAPFRIVQASDGFIYGLNGQNLIRLATDGTVTPAYTSPTHAALDWLTPGAAGGVYGAFSTSDTAPGGGIFSFTSSSYSIVHAFATTYPGGAFPRGGLVRRADGTLIGAAGGGLPAAGVDTGFGVVFTITPVGSFSILHAFTGGVADGDAPNYFGLATDGTLVGAANAPSPSGYSSVLRMRQDGSVSVLHAFNGLMGFNSVPVQGADGAFYGTTAGISSEFGVAPGTAYRVDGAGAFTTLHIFTAGEGKYPLGFVSGADGNLYGLTQYDGSLYRMAPNGTVTVIHRFNAATEGSSSHDPITLASDGSFYGVTVSGGANNQGTLFRATTAGTVTVLHAFTAAEGSAAGPLMQATDGTWFGVASSGSASPYGSVYALYPSGVFRVLYRFTGGADGANPSGALLQGLDGAIYGTNSGTGQVGDTTGVIFRLHLPPTITAVPSTTLRTVEGQISQITAGATSMSGVRVQWQVSVDNGATFTDIPGATAFVYEFVATTSQNGARYRAVFTNAVGTSATPSVTVIVRRAGARPVASDIDGDAQADLVIWRPDSGTWFTLPSSSGFSASASITAQWGSGALGDVPFLADMDGDGLADYVVWRASTGTWYWLTSSTGYSDANAGAIQWGSAALGDVPLLADMDGDGRADLIVWRPSTGLWYWLTSVSDYDYRQQHQFQWGSGAYGDVPLIADLDGDGIGDLVVWRPTTGTWYWVTSSTGYSLGTQGARQWGSAADVPLLGDIDGDGRADLVIWRPATGTWFWLPSATGYDYGAAQSVHWGSGALGDVPLLPDLDGDGRADLTVWRASTGTWYWLPSSSGYAYTAAQSRVWGAPGSRDIPVSR